MNESARRLTAAVIVIGCVLAAGCKNDRRATATCTPGTRVEIACGTGCGLGSCSGDPVLEVCAGDVSCARGDLGSNDDACGGLCPGVTITCPPGGVITIAPRPFGSGSFRCNWEMRELGGSTGAPLVGSDAGR